MKYLKDYCEDHGIRAIYDPTDGELSVHLAHVIVRFAAKRQPTLSFRRTHGVAATKTLHEIALQLALVEQLIQVFEESNEND